MSSATDASNQGRSQSRFVDGQPVWTLDEMEFHDVHEDHIAPDCTICDYEFSKDHMGDMGIQG
jgi:hypothetical protein